MLYDQVIEVDERLQLVDDKDRQPTDHRGISGEYVRVLKPLDVDDLRRQLEVRFVLFYWLYL